jgi:ABC-type lipoprotein export system ATPase subunit/ABC-type transporter Mla maintaining outer membrane lipid asymmetry permease subunit MlaE
MTIQLELDNICLQERGGRKLMSGFSTRLEPGQLVIFAGASGSGKSTLMELLAQLPLRTGIAYSGKLILADRVGSAPNAEPQTPDLPPKQAEPIEAAANAERPAVENTEGKSVRLEELHPDSHTMSYRADRNIRIGLVFQDGALFDDLSVEDNLIFGVEHAIQKASDEELARRQVWTKQNPAILVPGKSVSTLSGGQAQKVAIERTRRYLAGIVMLDEPTVGLDPYSAQQVVRDIYELASQALVIVITHELHNFVPPKGASQRVFVLGEGADRRVTDMSGVPIDDVIRELVARSSPEEIYAEEGPFQQIVRRLKCLLLCRDSGPLPARTGGMLAAIAAACVEHQVWNFPWLSMWKSLLAPLLSGVRRLKTGVRGAKRARWPWVLQFGAGIFYKSWLSVSAMIYFAIMGALLGFTLTFFLLDNFPHQPFTLPVVLDRLASAFGKSLYEVTIPLFTAILFASRSGAAVAADLGYRVRAKQTLAMQSFGVPAESYLVPSVYLAFLSGLWVLQFVTFAASFVGATIAYLMLQPARFLNGWTYHFFRELGGSLAAVGPVSQPLTWFKLGLTALVLASYTCHHGLRSKSDSQSISAHATDAVLASTIAVVLISFLFVLNATLAAAIATFAICLLFLVVWVAR